MAAIFCGDFRKMVQEWVHRFEYPKYASIICLDEFESCVSQPVGNDFEDFLGVQW